MQHDRFGEFEPQIIKKNQTKLSEEIDKKIISLLSIVMSYSDIKQHIADNYTLDVSEASITVITDKLLPELKAWQQRLLDALYPFVWLDIIHHKIKESKNKNFISIKKCIQY